MREGHELLKPSEGPFPVNADLSQSFYLYLNQMFRENFYLYPNQMFRENFLITLWKVLMMKTTGRFSGDLEASILI